MLKKYQIFVGATYNDLMEERSAAINQIIKQRHIPSGMENFGAMGEKQWNYICLLYTSPSPRDRG